MPEPREIGMSDPAVRPDRIAAVVEAGETDEVNDLIDELESLDLPAQLDVFDAAYDTLLDCMDHDDGYSRQAVVRVVSALDPATGRMVAETAPDQFESLPDDDRFVDAIDREAGFLIAALTDDDGRVRRAALRALNSLSTGCRLTGDRETLDRLAADIRSLSVDETKREHVEEALNTVRGGVL
jgi:hypothetical protein